MSKSAKRRAATRHKAKKRSASPKPSTEWAYTSPPKEYTRYDLDHATITARNDGVRDNDKVWNEARVPEVLRRERIAAFATLVNATAPGPFGTVTITIQDARAVLSELMRKQETG